MKRWAQNRLARVLAVILFVGLAAAWAVGESLDKHEVATRDTYEVARMTEKMKTVCVGRFLIDMPEAAQVALTEARIHGLDIAAFDEPIEEFQERLRQREADIKAKPDRLGGSRNLELAKDVKTKNGLVGKIFVHSRTVTEGTRAKGMEVERYRYEGVAIEALVHGHGVSIDLVTDDYHPDRIVNLLKLVAQLVPNPGNKAPEEPGFCIDRAYFRDPLKADQHERIMMFARLPSHPDIEFMLILAAGLKPDEEGLLERDASADALTALADKMRISKLRAAPREIAGLVGDELVRGAVEANEARVYSFWWEVNGTEDNVLAPHLVFKMNTGKGSDGPVPTSMSEGAALGLWDKISSSIRLRPTEPPKRAAAEPPLMPLGSYAWAGERCPESGWWQCSDGGNGIGVLGGQRQYIRKGERMPQALLLPPQTLWEKLRGVQPSFESKTQTSWKLVDKRGRKRVPAPLPLAQATPVAAASITSAGTGPGVMEQQGISVGSFAATGLPCPASGWWLCDDPRALDGTRWFAQGSLLPPATFALPPGGFSRSANSAKSIERRGAWRLVRLADAPGQDANDGAEPA